MEYAKAWIQNIFRDLLIVMGVCVVMYVFMKIFYPDALSLLFLSGQFGVGLVNTLKLWPLVILAVIVYAMPRRRPRRTR